jgi:hypothetical protein
MLRKPEYMIPRHLCGLRDARELAEIWIINAHR